MGRKKFNYNAFKADIEKYANNVAKHTAQEIADVLYQESKYVIEQFYNQYDPEDPYNPTFPPYREGRIYYYRNWNFRDVPKRYLRKYTGFYMAGVQLMKNDFPNDYSGKYSSPSSVFGRVMNSGWHGLASLTTDYVPTFTPSPMRRIEAKRDEIIKKQNEYKNRAQQKAQKDTYTYLFKQ